MINPWFVRRENCPACESGNFTTIHQMPFDESPIKDYLLAFYSPQGKIEFKYLEQANYVLCECGNCKMIFQRDIPNELLMERLYGNWINPQRSFALQQEAFDLNYYSDYAQEIMQVIAYLNAMPSSLRFLDFGMGWGKWAQMAKAYGVESFGTELSQEQIQNGKNNGIKVIAWDEIPQHSFDFINTEQVFEHIAEPLQTLRYLQGSLKKDGILKVSVPSSNNIKRSLRIMDWEALKGSENSLNPVAPLEHINCFRRESIIKMASMAGLEEIFIPIKIQYIFLTGKVGMKKIAKSMLHPIYRNILKKQNMIFLRKKKFSGNN